MRLILSFFTCCLILTLGCSGERPGPPPSAVASATVDLSVAMTVANTTYVPLNLDGDVSTHTVEILRVVEVFEKEHAELSVTSFDVQAQQRAHGVNAVTHGVWIHHRLREATTACVCPPA